MQFPEESILSGSLLTEAGEFDIQCREYCGLIHYNMRAKLFVEDI